MQKDTLILTALNLEIPDILSLCRSSAKFNDYICNNENFWRQKFNRDYPILVPYLNTEININHKDLYKLIYGKTDGKTDGYTLAFTNNIDIIGLFTSSFGKKSETIKLLKLYFPKLTFSYINVLINRNKKQIKKGDIVYLWNHDYYTKEDLMERIIKEEEEAMDMYGGTYVISDGINRILNTPFKKQKILLNRYNISPIKVF
jgi:hypothetical protein